MSILSALKSVPSMSEASIGPNGLFTNTGLVGATPNPAPVGPEVVGTGPDAITSWSELSGAAQGAQQGGNAHNPYAQPAGSLPAWPDTPNANALQRFNGWIKNAFHDFFKAAVGANYGEISSQANYGFRHQLYSVGNNGLGFVGGSVGNYPGPVPFAGRPMWNNLEAITWNMEVLDPSDLNPAQFQAIQQNPTEFVPGGTASIGVPGVVLQ